MTQPKCLDIGHQVHEESVDFIPLETEVFIRFDSNQCITKGDHFNCQLYGLLDFSL